MKYFHICNDFSLTMVHINLNTQFDALGLEQISFNPVKNYYTPLENKALDYKAFL